MALEIRKRIADPVHGTIGFTKVETDVLSTRTFLRLQHVRHLGLAPLVYPGANFSRFSHSLGSCAVAARFLERLQEVSAALTPETVQRYRLAALLHDVGHLPFSHTTEQAAKGYYPGKLVADDDDPQESDPPTAIEHERIGREVVEHDPELSEVLRQYDIDPRDVTRAFMREEVREEGAPNLANLIASDLDSDRIDYLLRMSHHTGLPYGAVDLDYLISQARVDPEGRICFSRKALRTAEHLLLQRFFAYQQIAYHKTVRGFEKALQAVISMLLADGAFDCSAQAIKGVVRREEWATWTDAYLLRIMDGFTQNLADDSAAKKLLDSILLRRPPKLVADWQTFKRRDERASIEREERRIQRALPEMSKAAQVSEELILVDLASTSLTNAGAEIPVSVEDLPKEEIAKMVYIYDGTGPSAELALAIPGTLLNVLSNNELHVLRIWVVGDRQDAQRLKDSIEEQELGLVGSG